MPFFSRILAALGTAWAAARLTMANYGLDASRYDSAWGPSGWPSPHTRFEYDEWDQRTIWERAHLLYDNSPPIRHAVRNMVAFTGLLTPLPQTSDEEWNRDAIATWNARTKCPTLFDLSGRLNYRQALAWLERRAIIDGDAAVVCTIGADGGARFAFYTGPQITGGGTMGVEVDAHNAPVTYYIQDAAGTSHPVPAHGVILYMHEPDPTGTRGKTELLAAIRTGQDIRESVREVKNGIHIANIMGLVLTRQQPATKPTLGPALPGARTNASPAAPAAPTELRGTGLAITELPAHTDLRPIFDNRPSQQLQQFWAFQVRCIAQAVGLDPEVLFYSSEMGSAAARLVLQKVSRWVEGRLEDMQVLCNRMWQHVIACEVQAGRLRPCTDAAWLHPHWVPSRDMSIDTTRAATAQINLSREGMADDDDFSLRTTGRTWLANLTARARSLAAARQVAEQHGLTLAELIPGMPGTTPIAAAPEQDEPAPPHNPNTIPTHA